LTEDLLLGLASVVVLGTGAQWLAWRLGIPSILLLLVAGILAGPVTGFLNPTRLFGDLLLPVVSFAVALILFEGGLSLRFSELRHLGRVVCNLITIGALVTWLVSTLAARHLLGLDGALALLFGAILIVTGPTVIIPLLRHVQPRPRISSILKWEGIVIDPIGAMIAVMVFEGIVATEVSSTLSLVGMGVTKTVLTGTLVGAAGALGMILFLRRYWIPDHLQSAATLAMVLAAFTAANLLYAESGLFAVTVLGIVLANQKSVSIKHLVEFKENLRVLLISGLFILLAARLEWSDFRHLSLGSLGFLGVLVLVSRPFAVFASTLSAPLTWKERLFLAGVAPRGIVAASVASIFSLRLVEHGHADAERLVPLTFMVILATVTIYGLAASPLARRLGLAHARRQGALFIGAHDWARSLALALKSEGFPVLLIDSNRENAAAAAADGLRALHANALSGKLLDQLELGGIGRVLALTSNDEVNSLAVMQFVEAFGRSEVYQIPPPGDLRGDEAAIPIHLRGRLLFAAEATYEALSATCQRGARVKVVDVTEGFDLKSCTAPDGGTLPLCVVTRTRELVFSTLDSPLAPRPGQKLIALVAPAPVADPEPELEAATAAAPSVA
jgi:NhaP-type Na+/H+ or K+/H+ antiporter